MITGELVVANGLSELIEVTIQLLFIADLKHKRISQQSGAKKHGRNIVTFLLITNLGLWITYNFEIQKVSSHLILISSRGIDVICKFYYR